MMNECEKCCFYEACHSDETCEDYYPVFSTIEEFLDSDEFINLKDEYYNDYICYLEENGSSI